MAQAGRKLGEPWALHGNQFTDQAMTLFGCLYDVHREVADADGRGEPGRWANADRQHPGREPNPAAFAMAGGLRP